VIAVQNRGQGTPGRPSPRSPEGPAQSALAAGDTEQHAGGAVPVGSSRTTLYGFQKRRRSRPRRLPASTAMVLPPAPERKVLSLAPEPLPPTHSRTRA